MEEKPANRVRIYGKVDDADGYAIRDFLRRTVIEFDWIELDL
ncbi:MAG: Thioredoxin reductase [Chloroflexi bacterium AL-W]|nr:Thioredoxin reductase [Chloroflexi bacterium AL-N1]NOK71427.1 Thioredoxin reductase [Chloroflexi bacterium AL-N10]NOK78830.1 Thioredoxin reductase [Chloroflexi bacterium AL-N5]NOK86248.1 Thioredoxin reductase [Chloroflexi bacterium AL-W]NOK93152.1 Thioredoxin reductase [Chloroflexi bacterium AL-N15]